MRATSKRGTKAQQQGQQRAGAVPRQIPTGHCAQYRDVTQSNGPKSVADRPAEAHHANVMSGDLIQETAHSG
jgi:hypothetical protein